MAVCPFAGLALPQRVSESGLQEGLAISGHLSDRCRIIGRSVKRGSMQSLPERQFAESKSVAT